MGFRLGTTSFVYPAGLLKNVEQLAPQVDDIELILWDLGEGETNFPDQATVGAMWDIAQAHDLTYTVHLPLDLQTDPSGYPRHKSLTQAKRVIKLTAPLEPYAYVFHLHTEDAGKHRWAKRGRRAIRSLGVEPLSLLALENLESYDPAYLEPIFDQVAVSRTLDIGHLWKMGRDPLPLLDAWLPHTRVVHIHGFDGDQDHLSLDVMPPAQLDPVMARLAGFEGVVTLEVFSQDEFERSKAALLTALERV